MKSGTVKLIYKNHVIKQLEYFSVNDRRDKIHNWKQQTGLKFDECYIQIRPKVGRLVDKQVYA